MIDSESESNVAQQNAIKEADTEELLKRELWEHPEVLDRPVPLAVQQALHGAHTPAGRGVGCRHRADDQPRRPRAEARPRADGCHQLGVVGVEGSHDCILVSAFWRSGGSALSLSLPGLTGDTDLGAVADGRLDIAAADWAGAAARGSTGQEHGTDASHDDRGRPSAHRNHKVARRGR